MLYSNNLTLEVTLEQIHADVRAVKLCDYGTVVIRVS